MIIQPPNLKLLFIILLQFISIVALAQYDFCPIERNFADLNCDLSSDSRSFVEKDIVKDFHADPTGRLNSHRSFECAAAYFNKRGGNGKLSIPYGKYKVGNQQFISPDSIFCNSSNYYGWVGKDLMHLVNCKNIKIAGISNKQNGRPPQINLQDSTKIGGFTKAGLPSTFTKYIEDEKRYILPVNCIESKKNNTYTAYPGSFFWFEDCEDVTISNLIIDGNTLKAKLGSYQGTGISPYELWGYGIVAWNTKGIILNKLTIMNQCTDGVLIKNYTDSGIITQSYHMQITNVSIVNSGRNNVSWVGGNGLTINNSSFGMAGKGKVKTDPGAGLDIEPEEHEARSSKCSYTTFNNKRILVKDVCTNSSFTDCRFYQNRLSDLLVVNDTVRVKDVFFNNCVFANTNQWTLTVNNTKSLLFINCKILGKWYIHDKLTPALSTKNGFINCLFESKP